MYRYPQGFPAGIFGFSSVSVLMDRISGADGFTLPAADAVFLNDCGDIRNDDGIRRTGAPASAAGNTCAGVDDVWNQG